MSGRSSNFSFAQLSSIVRAENWMQQEKISFTPTERVKLQRALTVLTKVQNAQPFMRAMNTLELYENAEKGIKLQKDLDSMRSDLLEVTRSKYMLLEKCARLQIQLELAEGKTFWARLLGLFRAKTN